MSAHTPSDQPSSEPFRARREASGPIPTPDDDTRTRIIRRHPTGPIPEPLSDDTRTGILRRAPSGPLPKPADDAPTSFVPTTDESATGIIRQPPRRIDRAVEESGSATAVAAASVSIISGWATAVVATDLVAGWWGTDTLFCIGVVFLTAVFGASTIAAVVALLLRRRIGIFLTIVAAVLALLIFAGIFVADARTSGIVRAIPALPVAMLFFVLLPPTWRWTRG